MICRCERDRESSVGSCLPGRGQAWGRRYAKYRLPDGRQVKKKLGLAWTQRGRPPTGYFTKRLAEEWLRAALDQARRGTLPGMVRTGATFADVAAAYLRYIEHDRGRKPSTVRGYRSAIEAHLLPVFGEMPVEDVTTEAIERWMAGFEGSPRSRNKLLIQLHGILGELAGLRADLERGGRCGEGSLSARAGYRRVLPRGDLGAGASSGLTQDGAIFLFAALTGLRMGELLALSWRDVDFTGRTIRVRASFYLGH